MDWFRNLSIRWKFQLAFFVVTMVTTIFNRVLAAHELQKMIDIARSGGAPAEVIRQLVDDRMLYIYNSFWESGLEFLVQFIIIGAIATVFVRPIKALCLALQAVEKGDLTRPVQVSQQDELGVLQRIFNDVLGTLNRILGEVGQSGKQMGQSAFQIATIAKTMAEVSRQEQSRSEAVVRVTGELHVMAGEARDLSGSAAQRTRAAEQEGRQAVEAVRRNIEEMEATASEVNRVSGEVFQLAETASQITVIIESIKEISAQTNLLALNAAIEAARAGEGGRGFAVVADEVRKLAERTTQSAAGVTEIVDSLTGRVGTVRDAMQVVIDRVHASQDVAHEISRVMESMASGVALATEANDRIAEAGIRQMTQLDEVQSSLELLFATLDESSTKVEVTARIGNDLHRVTQRMSDLMAGFVTHPVEDDVHKHNGDKRRFPRLDYGLLTELVQSGDGGRAQEALAVDFSLSGMKLSVSHVLDARRPVMVRLHIPANDIEAFQGQQPVEVPARVIWQREEENGRMVGIEFENVPSASQDKLRQCFAFFNKQAEYR